MIEMMDFGPLGSEIKTRWPCKCDCGACGCNCGPQSEAWAVHGSQNAAQVGGIISTSTFAGYLFDPMRP